MTKEIVRFTFRIPKRLLEKIEIEAKETGVSKNAKLLEILWQWQENQAQ